MKVEFISENESFGVPLTALSVPLILPQNDQPYYRALPHVPRYRSPRKIKHPALRQGLHLSRTSYGFIVDEVTYNILEFWWNEPDRRFIIKAEYPGLPTYIKKFGFDEYFLALEFWEEFTFLFYRRMEGWSLKKSSRRAKDHRRVVIRVMREIRRARAHAGP